MLQGPSGVLTVDVMLTVERVMEAHSIRDGHWGRGTERSHPPLPVACFVPGSDPFKVGPPSSCGSNVGKADAHVWHRVKWKNPLILSATCRCCPLSFAPSCLRGPSSPLEAPCVRTPYNNGTTPEPINLPQQDWATRRESGVRPISLPFKYFYLSLSAFQLFLFFPFYAQVIFFTKLLTNTDQLSAWRQPVFPFVLFLPGDCIRV